MGQGVAAPKFFIGRELVEVEWGRLGSGVGQSRDLNSFDVFDIWTKGK